VVIFCGESLIDLVGNTKKIYTPHVGGSILNSAIAFGRLTGDSFYMGGVSTDEYGELISKNLSDSSVKSDFFIRTDRPTTLAYVDLDSEGVAKYRFEDEASAGRLISIDELKPFLEDIKKMDALLVGGISLQSEPCGTSLEWVTECLKKETNIYYDPNIRPSFIKDRELYIERYQRIISRSTFLKLSEEDSEYIYGKKNLDSIVDEIFLSGIKIILHTIGKKGVRVYMDSGETFTASVQPTKVIDTIGAGDSFNAGFLYYLDSKNHLQDKNLDKGAIQDAVKFANKVARYTVSQKGANPPRLDQIN
jgi:fructokinase